MGSFDSGSHINISLFVSFHTFKLKLESFSIPPYSSACKSQIMMLLHFHSQVNSPMINHWTTCCLYIYVSTHHHHTYHLSISLVLSNTPIHTVNILMLCHSFHLLILRFINVSIYSSFLLILKTSTEYIITFFTS